MTSRITTKFRRAFRSSPATHQEDVHLHLGNDGRPYVCDLARCDSPSLSVDEADRAAGVL
jgi:hypothetical protein